VTGDGDSFFQEEILKLNSLFYMHLIQ